MSFITESQQRALDIHNKLMKPERKPLSFRSKIVSIRKRDEKGPVFRLMPHSDTRMPPWRRILLEVSKSRGIGVKDILSDDRSDDVVAARHEVMWRLRGETTMSLPRIGFRLNKDHSSVLHGIRKHAERLLAK